MSDATTRRNALERRLHDGWDRINEAEAMGKDVRDWETFWIELLREYEAMCDELAGMAS